MFFLREPSLQTCAEFIASQKHQPFTYAEVGGTKSEPPASYVIDHNRIKLGMGEATYERAITALRRWEQFNLGWVKIVPDSTPLEAGNTVAVRAHTFGVWSLSAARIVYLVDEASPFRRFGFAYGTLPDHVEQGEERFTIELRDDGSVWYDILAFSRPHQFVVRLASPLARRLQRRFASESLKSMLAAVS